MKGGRRRKAARIGDKRSGPARPQNTSLTTCAVPKETVSWSATVDEVSPIHIYCTNINVSKSQIQVLELLLVRLSFYLSSFALVRHYERGALRSQRLLSHVRSQRQFAGIVQVLDLQGEVLICGQVLMSSQHWRASIHSVCIQTQPKLHLRVSWTKRAVFSMKTRNKTKTLPRMAREG